MIKDERYRPFFNKLIYYVTGINISDYKLIDQELNTGNNVKDYRLDILLEKDNQLVSIEMNRDASSYTLLKNHTYLYRLAGFGYSSGEEFTKKYVTQINFNNSYCTKDKDIGVVCYEFQNKELDSKIEGIKDYEIYLASYRGICYNKENEKEMMLSLLLGESYEEMELISSNNKEAKEMIEELERLGIDDKWCAIYDNEIIQKKLQNSARSYGYDKGAEDKTLEIAKNFLSLNVSIEDISKATGLSIDEIKSLK